ncbi:CAP domain-containing protein [Paenibacillus senegalensis]|uniref:CAP domain-containing protein n=1 Tax=Paenibacillus senegalensis TaxID=1465766 RepID=UPI000289FE95|nr:CAP domain-containing protein [Paenibacillus senegalensis]
MNKKFKTIALSGVLLASTVFSAGAASAAHGKQTQSYETVQVYHINLDSLLQANPQDLLDRLYDHINSNLPEGEWYIPWLEQVIPAVPEKEQPAPEPEQPAPTPAPEKGQPAPAPAPTPTPAPQPQQPDNAGSVEGVHELAQEVARLVNEERAKAGLGPLTLDADLSNMALDKAKDMYHNNYFSHNSPTYGSPFDMMNQYNIPYSYAGENIAKGQRTAEQVMNDWMNSEGHKKNILGPNFTKIGVSYYNDVWVQEFTG